MEKGYNMPDDPDDPHEILEHFKDFGNEDGKEVRYLFVANISSHKKNLFGDYISKYSIFESKEKFRIVIDYDPAYPRLAVKQIIDREHNQ